MGNVYGYVRVSTKNQNEDRLMCAGISVHFIKELLQISCAIRDSNNFNKFTLFVYKIENSIIIDVQATHSKVVPWFVRNEWIHLGKALQFSDGLTNPVYLAFGIIS